jgi:hypothetical protein
VVLIDDDLGKKIIGRSYMEAPDIDSFISFKGSDKLEVGDFLKILIVKNKGFRLEGELIQ